MDRSRLKQVLEGVLLAAGRPMSVDQISKLFEGDSDAPPRDEIRACLEELAGDCEGRGVELVQVAGGWRYQVPQGLEPWVGRLWEEKPARYSRALLETLALIVYRQPITRAEIEEVRGVSVGTNIIRTLQERDWIKVLGHKEVPGRPALYGTTRRFLDDFGLKSLDGLPGLADIADLDRIDPQLDLPDPEQDPQVVPRSPEPAADASPGTPEGAAMDAAAADAEPGPGLPVEAVVVDRVSDTRH